MEHVLIPTGERHGPHNWEFADAATRLAEVITDAALVGCTALQLDTGETYRLTDVTPVTWAICSVITWNSLTGTADEVPFTGGGALSWNDTDGTLDLPLKGGNVTLQIGQELLIRIYNNTGSPMTDMQVVKITGSQGQRLTASLAQATTEANSAATIAVVTEPISNNQEGFATIIGLVRNVNTSGFSEGAALYLSAVTPGVITATQPTAPNHSVRIGWCVRSHATQGSIFVNVHNGYALETLHDVLLTNKTSGDVLAWNGTVWANKALAKGDIGLGNVDNTSDANKPVSIAQALADTAIYNSATAASTPVAHATDTNNPHSVTKTQVGLGNVDNTSDADKPVSTAQATALAGKTNMTGFPVDANGAYLCTLTYNESTRTVTITPTGVSFDIYISGVKYTFIGAQSITHSATGASHFIYFNASGVLTAATSPWDMLLHAPACYVFQDVSNSRRIAFDDRHHAGRDLYWHRNQHAAEGTKATSGFAASGYTLSNGASDGVLQIAIASGRVEDEDIRIDTQALAAAGPYNLLYRSGASGDWLITRTSTLPFFYSGNKLQYNQNTGATWQLTNVTEDNFVNYWVFALTALPTTDVTPTPSSTQQLIIIAGQAIYASQALADAETVSSLAYGSVPFQEMAPLYKLTYRFNASAPSAYTNTARTALMAISRVVGTYASVTATAQTDHGSLTGLTDQDHPASAIIFTPTGNIAATDVQAAIAEVDSEKNVMPTEAITITTNNLPVVRPTLLIDFANSKSVDPRITITRASTAMRTNANGLLESVASGLPRIDYDPVTLACKGLLIEESRTNLLTYSEQFDSAAWLKQRSSISANATTAPDGTVTADKFVEDNTASNTHYVYKNNVTITANTAHTASIFLKAAERTFAVIELTDGTSAQGAVVGVNLTTGELGTPYIRGSGSAQVATVTAYPNSWYRVTISCVVDAASTAADLVLYTATSLISSGYPIYSGDGTSGIYIWGAQLEAGAFATSYIPTTSAQVTRAADTATMTGTNFSSWYRQDEFTSVVKFIGNAVGTQVYAKWNDGTTNEEIKMESVSGTLTLTVTDGGVAQASLALGSVVTGTTYTVAATWKVNDIAASINGGAVVTDSSATLPAPTQRVLSSNAYVRGYPSRLANATLIALSTP